MNQAQIDSIARSALKIGGAILITHGLTQYAAILNTEDAVGLVIALLGVWQSHQQHAALPLATRLESTIPIVAHEVTSAGAGGVAGTPPESPIGNPQ